MMFFCLTYYRREVTSARWLRLQLSTVYFVTTAMLLKSVHRTDETTVLKTTHIVLMLRTRVSLYDIVNVIVLTLTCCIGRACTLLSELRCTANEIGLGNKTVGWIMRVLTVVLIKFAATSAGSE